MKTTPSFFKVFIAERNGIDMEIPKAFSRLMEDALPEKVFLRDRHNNLWTVKLAKVGGSWYFVDGWDKFVEDNLLTTGDFLVFKYFSDRLFHVKLYGPSASEKNAVEPSLHRGKEKTHEQVSEYDEDDDDGGGALIRLQENEHKEVVRRNNDGVVGGSSRQRKLVYLYPKCYGIEIFKAGVAEQPANPYFVVKIMPKRTGDLFIPQDVIKDYNLKLGNEIVLVDPNGREFIAKCRKWTDGRSIISGGWRSLCRVNLVSLEDTCICEFVQREGDVRQFLYISFVRGSIAFSTSVQN